MYVYVIFVSFALGILGSGDALPTWCIFKLCWLHLLFLWLHAISPQKCKSANSASTSLLFPSHFLPGPSACVAVAWATRQINPSRDWNRLASKAALMQLVYMKLETRALICQNQYPELADFKWRDVTNWNFTKGFRVFMVCTASFLLGVSRLSRNSEDATIMYF